MRKQLLERLNSLQLQWQEGEGEYEATHEGMRVRLRMHDSVSLFVHRGEKLVALHQPELPSIEQDLLKVLALSAWGPSDDDIRFIIGSDTPKSEEPVQAEPKPDPIIVGELEEMIGKLKDKFHGTGEVFKQPEFEYTTLDRLLEHLGPPVLPCTAVDADQTVEALLIATAGLPHLGLPKIEQEMFTQYIAARWAMLRWQMGMVNTAQLTTIRQRLIDAGIDSYVRGLRHTDKHRLDTWQEEAEFLLKALDGPESVPVRIDAQTEEVPVIPADWEFFSLTKGKKGLLIGGTPREPSRAKLEHVFQFSTLDWSEITPRTEPSFVKQIKNGSYHFVLILSSLARGSLSEKMVTAAKKGKVKFCTVQGGYSVSAVKMAIEKWG